MAKNEVAKAKSTALGLPEELAALFEENAGAGTSEVEMSDMQLPVIKQVQDISPERDSQAPEYIEGADTGDFFNSVTREVYKGPLEVIPANIRKTVVAFTPRSQGGGFKGEYESKEQALEYLDSPAELNDTIEIAMLYRPAGDENAPWQPAIMNMTSTKMKPARALMTLLMTLRIPVGEKSIQPPSYGVVFEMASVRAKNAKGTYRNIAFRFLRPVEDTAAFHEAKKFGEVMAARELRHGQDEEVYGVDTDDDKPNF